MSPPTSSPSCARKPAATPTTAAFQSSSESSRLRSEPFRAQWAAHNVRFHDKGTKRLHHPIVGELTLTFETMQLTADTGLTMAAYTVEPASKSEEALKLLASWTATPDQAASAHATD